VQFLPVLLFGVEVEGVRTPIAEQSLTFVSRRTPRNHEKYSTACLASERREHANERHVCATRGNFRECFKASGLGLHQKAREGTMKDIMRGELAAPKIVDRSSFQAELDALRV
jgi:hypothetical protein